MCWRAIENFPLSEAPSILPNKVLDRRVRESRRSTVYQGLRFRCAVEIPDKETKVRSVCAAIDWSVQSYSAYFIFPLSLSLQQLRSNQQMVSLLLLPCLFFPLKKRKLYFANVTHTLSMKPFSLEKLVPYISKLRCFLSSCFSFLYFSFISLKPIPFAA